MIDTFRHAGVFVNASAVECDAKNTILIANAFQIRRRNGNARAAGVLLKMLGEETVQEDPAADALEAARKLLGGVDSAID